MNSLFIINQTNQSATIKEVHLNLWMVGDERFLDIGLRLEPNQIIELYLPWKNANLVDLYDSMLDVQVLNAIFNQHLSINTDSGASHATVTRGIDSFDLVKVKNLKGENFTLPHSTGSTSATKVMIEPIKATTNDAYLRIRARGFGEEIFSTAHSGNDSVVNPYRETIEAIDFRVNEIRTVAQDAFNKTALCIPAINKLHFFLVKSFRETNLLCSPAYDRCRELEDKAWETYLSPMKINGETILAYHWKKSELAKGDHFSVLATFGCKRVSKRIIFLYLAVILVLNLVSSVIYEYSPKIYSYGISKVRQPAIEECEKLSPDCHKLTK